MQSSYIQRSGGRGRGDKVEEANVRMAVEHSAREKRDGRRGKGRRSGHDIKLPSPKMTPEEVVGDLKRLGIKPFTLNDWAPAVDDGAGAFPPGYRESVPPGDALAVSAPSGRDPISGDPSSLQELVKIEGGSWYFPEAKFVFTNQTVPDDSQTTVEPSIATDEPKSKAPVLFHGRKRAVIDLIDRRDGRRSTSFSYAAKHLGNSDLTRDWAGLMGGNAELGVAAIKRVMWYYTSEVSRLMRIGALDSRFARAATIDVYSVSLALLDRVTGMAGLETGADMTALEILRGGMNDDIMRTALEPMLAGGVPEDGGLGLCYTFKLIPEISIRGRVLTVQLRDAGQRILHPRMAVNDFVNTMEANIRLSGWDDMSTPWDSGGRPSLGRMQYEVELRVNMTTNNGHHMIAFDINPSEDFSVPAPNTARPGHNVKLRDVLARVTTFQVISGRITSEPIPFYIENGGLASGRVVIHAFCGVNPSMEGEYHAWANIADAETRGHDIAECMNSVTDGVVGLLVSMAKQMKSNEEGRIPHVRIQEGVGSFYPAHIATTVGNLIGTRYATHYETYYLQAGQSILLARNSDSVVPSKRVGQFLMKMCAVVLEKTRLSAGDEASLQAMFRLYYAVHIYTELVGSLQNKTTAVSDNIFALVDLVNSMSAGSRHDVIYTAIISMAKDKVHELHTEFKVLFLEGVGSNDRPDRMYDYARLSGGVSEEMENLGEQIIDVLRSHSFERNFGRNL